LDGFFKSKGISPDLMKIDVEGAEGLVLKGAMETLKVHRPTIFLETYKNLMSRHGNTPEELFSELKDFGYDIHNIPKFRGASSPKLAEVDFERDRPNSMWMAQPRD